MAIKKNNRLNRILNSGVSNSSNLSKSWLYCRWVLYILFILSIGNIYYLLLSGDYFTLAVFILVAFLTTFFSKNMVVILCISLVISTITKSVQVKEGLELSNNDLNTVEKLMNKFGIVKEGAKDKTSDDKDSSSKKPDSKKSSSDSDSDSSSKKSDSSSKKSDSESNSSSSSSSSEKSENSEDDNKESYSNKNSNSDKKSDKTSNSSEPSSKNKDK
jgi:hypothetical protein